MTVNFGAVNEFKEEFRGQKGVLDLENYNLAHRMIAKGFSLDQSVKFLLESFKLQNSFGAEKDLPECTMILNRNADFDKGVNKILKMICSLESSPQEICTFITRHFPIGMLVFRNLLSLLRFLVRSDQDSSPSSTQARDILQALFATGFFINHADSLSQIQVVALNEQISEASTTLEFCTQIEVIEGVTSDDLENELSQ